MIEIEFSDETISKAVGITPEECRAIIVEMAELARDEIVRLAAEKLNTSFDDYIAGLQPIEYVFPSGNTLPTGQTVAIIRLDGELPNRIESGWEGGDMKPGLLHGRNSKPTKDGGRYNVVPFRHMGPGTTGRNGQPMGSQFTAMLGPVQARQVGDAVYAMAKKMKDRQRMPEGMAPILKSHHKSDIFAGMVRERQQYKKGVQSKYTTFRAVSSKSDPRSWIHPGIKAANLFPAAQAYIDQVMDAYIKSRSEG